MTNGEVCGYCAKKPGAYGDRPFGDVPVCFKVCGRIFLQLYPHPGNHKITVSCGADLAIFSARSSRAMLCRGITAPAGLGRT